MAPPLRTAWHPLLVTAVKGIAEAPDYDVRDEFPLTREPLRLDVLILRAEPGAPEPDLLPSLLSSLRTHTIISYKGATDEPEKEDVIQLVAYGHQYMIVAGLTDPSQVGLRMLASTITPRFLEQVRVQGGAVRPSSRGIWEGTLGPFALRCISASVVCDHPGDTLLFGLSKRMLSTPRRFPTLTEREQLLFARMAQQVEQLRANSDEMMYLGLDMAATNYEQAMQEILDKMPLEKRLAGLAPEQRLAGLAPETVLATFDAEQRVSGLAPEQRLAGLDSAHAVLALPLELLRVLPAEYIATLPEDVRDEVRRRLAG